MKKLAFFVIIILPIIVLSACNQADQQRLATTENSQTEPLFTLDDQQPDLNDLTAEDVLRKAIQAEKQVKSVKVEKKTLSVKNTGGMEEECKSRTTIEQTMDPPITHIVKESPNSLFEAYLQSESAYVKGNEDKDWFFFQNDHRNPPGSIAHRLLKRLERNAESMLLKEDDLYTLSFELRDQQSQSLQQQLLEISLHDQMIFSDEATLSLLEQSQLLHTKLTLAVDPHTYHILSVDLMHEFHHKSQDDNVLHLEQSQWTFIQHNQIESFPVPSEIMEAAIDYDAWMEDISQFDNTGETKKSE